MFGRDRKRAEEAGVSVEELRRRTAAEKAGRTRKVGVSAQVLLDRYDFDEGDEVISAVGGIVLYRNPLRLRIPAEVAGGSGETRPVAAGVTAEVEAAGNIAAIRGRNLAAKGAATLALGPLGAFMVGNAKTDVLDTRELYLILSGLDWSHVAVLPPGLGGAARHLATAIHVAETASPLKPPALPPLLALSKPSNGSLRYAAKGCLPTRSSRPRNNASSGRCRGLRPSAVRSLPHP